jgi:signal transduction histidine kinase
LSQLIKGALAEMRALLLELRPGSLAQTGLDELLRNLADVTASRTQANVALRVEGECLLPRDVHNMLYRLAQEAMNNVARHAGATDIEVRLRCQPDRVTLSVSDDGRGFDPAQTPSGQHLGLEIMRERAEEIGAALEISSQPGRGTQVIVTWSA